MRPLPLAPNPVNRFYRGGARIAAMRGLAAAGTHVPEDWIASTIPVRGGTREGLGHACDGRSVHDLIAADPTAFLGPEHVAVYGPDPALLVKLLDAGERLPVHLHPGRTLTAERWGMAFGKTEAWVIISAPPEACVWLGFTADQDPVQLADRVRRRDGDQLLASLRQVPVAAGDALLVPAGVPHAIGAGVLLLELQEPTDLSILLEWEGHTSEDDAHLGLGWDRALMALDLAVMDDRRAASLRGNSRTPGRILPALADPYFRAERIDASVPVELKPGFSILVALRGAGEITHDQGEPVQIRAGGSVLVPWAAGPCRVHGDMTAVRCCPPAPHSSSGLW